MKKTLLNLMMILITTLSLSGNEETFYFVAKSTNDGVYLRWDAVEGNFPQNATIDYLVLKRNDVNISTFNPNAIMAEEQIQALYEQPENQAHLMKLIDGIAKNDDDACSGANLSNYASKIQLCMQNTLWRSMASKVDFNIATIGYRAYLDKVVPTTITSYELLAVQEGVDGNTTQRLGKVLVDPALPTAVLGAKNFKQIYQVTGEKRCSLPEYAKDDYSISLSWENGGNQTDAFANSMMLAGYDLYRDRVNNQSAPQDTTQFASLTAARVDGNGDYQFPNLEKVNDVSYLLANSEGEETALYLATKSELKQSGLKPGDSRWYYLVAKDFTGHYGPAVAQKVTVPNLLPPVTPWGVRVVESNKKAKLIWDNITVANYAKHYKNSRKFCNVDTLSESERLRFVDKEGTCGSEELEVNLNVNKYYVYRFDNPSQAAKFQDSDLDGIGDLDENPEDQCVRSATLGSALVKVLDANDFTAQEFVSFVDTEVEQSKHYWYRIAAVSERGTLVQGSILTSPIRAMIPDRTLPQKVKPELKACASDYIVAAYSLEGEIPYIAYDETQTAKEVRLTCTSNVDFALFRTTTYLPVDENGYVASSQSLCDCNGGTIEFLDEKRNVLASKSLCSGFINGCSSAKEFYVLKAYDCSYDGLQVVHGGEDLNSWPIVELEEALPKDECLEFSLIVGSKRVKLAQKCDGAQQYDLADFNLSNMGKGEKFCMGLNVLNENNQYSPTTYLPCFGVVDSTPPNKPDVRGLVIHENNISIEWIAPQEKIASTIISLYNDENRSQSYLRTVAHPNHTNEISMEALTLAEDMEVDLSESNRAQKWCAKAKSLGFNGKTSAWSSIKCTQNLAEDTQTEYLPWPKIASVAQQEVFEMDYKNMQTVTPLLAKLFVNGLIMPLGYKEFSIVGDDDFNYGTNFYSNERFYSEIEQQFKAIPLNFMLYRQHIVDDEKSNFIQVSPLVQRLKYRKFLTAYTSDNDRYTHYVLQFENNLFVDVSVYGKTTFECKATLYYKDNYPYYKDTQYQYVKVNFDNTHEITNYSTSNVVLTGEEEPTLTPILPVFEMSSDAEVFQPYIQQLEVLPNLSIGGAQ